MELVKGKSAPFSKIYFILRKYFEHLDCIAECIYFYMSKTLYYTLFFLLLKSSNPFSVSLTRFPIVRLLIILVNSIWISRRMQIYFVVSLAKFQNARRVSYDLTLMVGSCRVEFSHITLPYLSDDRWIFDCKCCYQ